jgi:hypothetical protein
MWQTIDTSMTINELAKKEIYWINHFDSILNGYNSDRGGGFKKSIYQYQLDSRELVCEYEDLKSAASACNASKQDISRAALSVNKECRGYLWSYEKSEILPYTVDIRKKGVLQLDKAGATLNAFKSVSEASQVTGISKTCIARVCRGERNSTGGYKWK